ncbi:MAG: prephenate/arogenate dehydrogenase family protein, partial [Pelagibacteraceae bacterium]|nr:prephenate/arogenate dehydrogenase family protein [Pelagibacteraceae bacterium]
MFKKICIIGCGLIGSSLARAIKKYNLSEKIVSSNRSDIVNKKVLELKMVNDSSSDTQKMAKDSD